MDVYIVQFFPSLTVYKTGGNIIYKMSNFTIEVPYSAKLIDISYSIAYPSEQLLKRKDSMSNTSTISTNASTTAAFSRRASIQQENINMAKHYSITPKTDILITTLGAASDHGGGSLKTVEPIDSKKNIPIKITGNNDFTTAIMPISPSLLKYKNSSMNFHEEASIKLQISKLKDDFNEILALSENITNIRNYFEDITLQIRKIYETLSNKHSQNSSYALGLETFYFQKKIIDLEIINITQIILILNNHLYCDYYKLYNLILNEISFLREKEQKNKYPKYNLLNPLIQYKTEKIIQLHNNIIVFFNELWTCIESKNKTLVEYNKLYANGISINNIIHTMNYEKNILLEKLFLYINFMNYFHNSQKTIILKLKSNIENFQSEFLEDIKIKDNVIPMSPVGLNITRNLNSVGTIIGDGNIEIPDMIVPVIPRITGMTKMSRSMQDLNKYFLSATEEGNNINAQYHSNSSDTSTTPRSEYGEELNEKSTDDTTPNTINEQMNRFYDIYDLSSIRSENFDMKK